MNSSNDQYIVDNDLPPQKLCGLRITMATMLLRVVHEFSSQVGTVSHSNAVKMICTEMSSDQLIRLLHTSYYHILIASTDC